MLSTLIFFLLGCLVLLVFLYAVDLVLGRLKLPDDIKSLAYLIIAVLAFIVLLYMTWARVGAF